MPLCFRGIPREEERGCRLSERLQGGGKEPSVSDRGIRPEIKGVDIREED
jgi:hypothetical protein